MHRFQSHFAGGDCLVSDLVGQIQAPGDEILDAASSEQPYTVVHARTVANVAAGRPFWAVARDAELLG